MKKESRDVSTGTVIKAIKRNYEEVTITKVDGECPYGHKEGEEFNVTSLNHDGLCGSLYSAIHPSIVTVNYGGVAPWERETGVFRRQCPEMGIVQVEGKHMENEGSKILRTKIDVKDMTGKGFTSLDKYRVFVEILGVERHCTWAHKEGQRYEVDPFNIGEVCGNLFWGAYHFIELLFAGGKLPWGSDSNIIRSMCPDIFNQCSFHLVREER